MKLALPIALAALLAAAPAGAAGVADPDGSPTMLPPVVREVDIDERLGKSLDPSLEFTDAGGRRVRLADHLGGGKPVLLVLAYYRCPTLCGLVLKGAVDGLKKLGWELGDQYRALTVSFDPKDTPGAAGDKQRSTLLALGTMGREAEWPFWVGEEASIKRLADGLGFRFAYDPASEQYAHPAAIFVLTPEGRISRYLYGVDFKPRDLRLSLLEASEGKIGTIVDRVMMTCYRFDPAARAYGPYIFGFMRLGAVFILAVVGGTLGALWYGEKQRNKRRGGATP